MFRSISLSERECNSRFIYTEIPLLILIVFFIYFKDFNALRSVQFLSISGIITCNCESMANFAHSWLRFIYQMLIMESCPVRGNSGKQQQLASITNLQLATCHLPRCSMQLCLGLASFLLINKSTDTRQSYAKRIRRMGEWAFKRECGRGTAVFICILCQLGTSFQN